MASPSANVNNPTVKRILREAREVRSPFAPRLPAPAARARSLDAPRPPRLWPQIRDAGPSPDFDAAPLEDNLFEWHFTIRGPPGTAFDGGRYHGRITLPPEYPFKPPSIALLNASGRFEVGKKICLSVSAHHPEHWQPAWDVRTIITALIAFFPSKAEGALAGLDYPDGERRALAAASRGWRCARCDLCMADALPLADTDAAASTLPPPPAELRFAHEGPGTPGAASAASPGAPAASAASPGAPASPAANARSAAPSSASAQTSATCEPCHAEAAPAMPETPTEPVTPSPVAAPPASPSAASSAAPSPQVHQLPPMPARQIRVPPPAPPRWQPSNQLLDIIAALLVGAIAMLVTRKLMKPGMPWGEPLEDDDEFELLPGYGNYEAGV
jgi:ubiquitin-conjugating enzyme E2 J1